MTDLTVGTWTTQGMVRPAMLNLVQQVNADVGFPQKDTAGCPAPAPRRLLRLLSAP